MAIIKNLNPFAFVLGTKGADQVTVGDYALVFLFDGSDSLSGGAHVTVNSGAGDDTIVLSDYATVYAGRGADTITVGNYSFVSAGGGADTIYVGAYGVTVQTSGGGDKVVVTDVAPTKAEDLFFGSVSGVDTLQIRMTTAQWVASTTQADIKGFLASQKRGADSYDFKYMNIDAWNFDVLTAVIDGYTVNTALNNAPIIAGGGFAGGVTQIAIASPSDLSTLDATGGAIAFRDFDLADKHVVSITPSGSGYLGTLSATVAADSAGTTQGTVSWSYSVVNGAIAYLTAGQTLTQTYTIKLADNNGGAVTQQVAVTIAGVNDAAVISDPGDASVTQSVDVNRAGNLTASGVISIVDPDLNQSAFQTTVAAAAGDLGTLALSADGSYTYSVAESAVTYLGQGETKVDAFTIKSVDGTSKTVLFNINGANDAPVASPISASDLADGGPIILTASFTDPDLNDAHSFSIDTNGTLGSVVDNGDGTFTYDPTGDFTNLHVGGVASDSFRYTVTDSSNASSAATATITINGEAPLAPGGAYETDQNTPLTETLPTTLIDAGEAYSLTIAGQTINLKGGNGSKSSGSDAVSFASLSSQSLSLDGGVLMLHSDGTFTFDPNGGFDYLGAGSSTTESFDYTVTDAHGSDTGAIKITIDGVNDAPVVSAISTIDLADGGAVALAADFVDPDVGDIHTFSVDTTGTLGVVVNHGDGTFSYNPNGQFGNLHVGESVKDSFQYTVTDAAKDLATATATVQIEGDVPLALDAAYTTDQNAAITEALPISLIDDTEAFSLSIVDSSITVLASGSSGSLPSIGSGLGQSGRATLTLGAEGTFTFDPNGEFDFLGATESATINVDYKVSDVHGSDTGKLTITVNGLNDAPVASAISGGEYSDGGPLTLMPDFVDPDRDDTDTISVNTTGTHGAVTVNADGTISYDPTGAFFGLEVGQSTTDTFQYTVTDSANAVSTAAATVTIHGDEPVAAGAGYATDQSTPVTGALPASLIDSGEAYRLTIDGQSVDLSGASGVLSYASDATDMLDGGKLTLNADGTFTFDPHGAFDYLAQGDSKLESFQYTVEDAHGASTGTVSIRIDGLDDPAVIGDPSNASVIEDTNVDSSGNLTATGVISIQDPDQGQSSFQSTVTAAQGDLGALALNANGSYTYTVANSAVQSLNSGDVKTDSFTVTSLDGTTKTLNFRINGLNDLTRRTPATDYVRASALSASTNDTLGLTLSAPVETADGQVRISGVVGYGYSSLQHVNLVYLIDASGSLGNTGFAQELRGYETLTQSLVDAGYGSIANVTLIEFATGAFNKGSFALSDPTLQSTLGSLTYLSGSTYYKDAFTAGLNVFKAANLIAPAQNVMYLASDGNPNPATSQNPASLYTALKAADVTVEAYGALSSAPNMTNLNAIDSDGAVLVSDPNQLGDIMSQSPLALSALSQLQLSVDGGAPTDLKVVTTNTPLGLQFTATSTVSIADKRASNFTVTAVTDDASHTSVSASLDVADAGNPNAYALSSGGGVANIFDFNAGVGETLDVHQILGAPLTAANVTSYFALSALMDANNDGVAQDRELLFDANGTGHTTKVVANLIAPNGVSSVHDIFHV